MPVYPPESLLKDCPIAEIEGQRTEDLLNLKDELEISLKKCNLDKQGLREWKLEHLDSANNKK